MERTKQRVLSAFKAPFTRKGQQQSKQGDEAAAIPASQPFHHLPPPTSSISSDRFDLVIGAHPKSVSPHEKPSSFFPSELPPRLQRQSMLAFNKKREASDNNIPLAPAYPITPPLSPGASNSYALPPDHHPSQTHDHGRPFITPPPSPTPNTYSNIFSAGNCASHNQKPHTSSTHPYPVENTLSDYSPFIGCKPLSPKDTAILSAENKPNPPVDPSRPLPDRLAERLAKLRVTSSAPTTSPQVDSRPLLTLDENICPGPRRVPKRASEDFAMTIHGPIRRSPTGEASTPCAGPSRTNNNEQTPAFNPKRKSREDDTRSPVLDLYQTTPYRRAFRSTPQRRTPPSTFSVDSNRQGRNTKRSSRQKTTRERSLPANSDDELAIALARSVAEAHKSRSTPIALPKSLRIDRRAAAIQEENDRQLAEELQREERDRKLAEELQSKEDERYNELHSATRHSMPSWPRTSRNVITSASNRTNYYSISRGVQHNTIELSSYSAESDMEVELSSDSAELDMEAEDWIRQQEESEPMMLVEDSGDESAQAEQTEEQRNATTKELECVVCGEPIPSADLPCLVSCTHKPQTCGDCFAAWIKSELEKKGWQSIKCPGSDCRVILAHHEVQKYATREVFDQYDSFAMRAALGDDPNFRWCRASGCNSGQVHLNGEDGNIFRCAACGHRVCIIHNDTFHEGETCQEFDYRTSGRKERDQRRQEEASERAVRKFSKKCPGKGCNFNIQKTEGCDHMTCSQCRHEFCWECLADYRKIDRRGNDAHKKSCKHHSDRIPGPDSDDEFI